MTLIAKENQDLVLFVVAMKSKFSRNSARVRSFLDMRTPKDVPSLSSIDEWDPQLPSKTTHSLVIENDSSNQRRLRGVLPNDLYKLVKFHLSFIGEQLCIIPEMKVLHSNTLSSLQITCSRALSRILS